MCEKHFIRSIPQAKTPCGDISDKMFHLSYGKSLFGVVRRIRRLAVIFLTEFFVYEIPKVPLGVGSRWTCPFYVFVVL